MAKRISVRVQAGGLFKRKGVNGRGRIADAEVVLAKPQTFYNGTGRAVAQRRRRRRAREKPHRRLRRPRPARRPHPPAAAGRDGGNNGLKSIIGATGSDEFGRIRVGIGRPARAVPTWDPDTVMDYLLAAPPRASQEVLDAACERAADAMESVIRDGWERAMNTYNRKEPGEQG